MINLIIFDETPSVSALFLGANDLTSLTNFQNEYQIYLSAPLVKYLGVSH
jgi:hypothetical protein